jgi:hypothetical protein
MDKEYYSSDDDYNDYTSLCEYDRTKGEKDLYEYRRVITCLEKTIDDDIAGNIEYVRLSILYQALGEFEKKLKLDQKLLFRIFRVDGFYGRHNGTTGKALNPTTDIWLDQSVHVEIILLIEKLRQVKNLEAIQEELEYFKYTYKDTKVDKEFLDALKKRYHDNDKVINLLKILEYEKLNAKY